MWGALVNAVELGINKHINFRPFSKKLLLKENKIYSYDLPEETEGHQNWPGLYTVFFKSMSCKTFFPLKVNTERIRC